MLLRMLSDQAAEIAALKAELAERRDQVRAIIEHSPHPTWVYSLQSLSFLDVNQVAVQAYGWSRDEFLGMTIADIRPREDVPTLLENLARMKRCPGGTTGPWRHRHKDGALLDVHISFSSLPFAGQSARLIVAGAAPAQRAAAGPDSLCKLSPREREVFSLVARGHTSQEIAQRLGVSAKSVETYRARFMMKLMLTSRAEIVQVAIAQGILGDD